MIIVSPEVMYLILHHAKQQNTGMLLYTRWHYTLLHIHDTDAMLNLRLRPRGLI